ncbi:peroxygenase, partial [Lecanoromycetidae sp. Uapishka_2]
MDNASNDKSTAVSPDNLTIKERPFQTTISEQPVTEERRPYKPPPDSVLTNPGTARATIAASHEKPNGTTENHWAATHQHQTVVQQHVEYWDTDHDGIIWPRDTYDGCRKWGWSPPLALLATLIINLNLSYPTLPGFMPDPFFRIYLDKLYKDKHGSDSMTYDNGLATYLLLWPEDGIMKKEDIRGVYDGSIFYKKADEYQQKQARRRQEQKGTSPGLVSMAKSLL